MAIAVAAAAALMEPPHLLPDWRQDKFPGSTEEDGDGNCANPNERNDGPFRNRFRIEAPAGDLARGARPMFIGDWPAVLKYRSEGGGSVDRRPFVPPNVLYRKPSWPRAPALLLRAFGNVRREFYDGAVR